MRIVLFGLLFFGRCFCANNSIYDVENTKEFNQKLQSLRDSVEEKFFEARSLADQNADKSDFLSLHQEIQSLKHQIVSAEDTWRKSRVKESIEEEGYVLWDQGETTISQVIMEYGSSDYLYVIPQEVGSIKIHLYSSIPMPHESWDEMIACLLMQSGVGVKKINPFTKQLYLFKKDPNYVKAILKSENDLEFLKDTDRVMYVFAPKVEKLKSTKLFFEKFSDPKQTLVQVVGTRVIIVSHKESIKRLLGLYKSIWENEKGKEMKVLPLRKLKVSEGEKILKEFFTENASKARASFFKYQGEELKILPLAQEGSLILIGDKELVDRAIEVIEDVENQIEDPSKMTIYWYTCKHSDPDDLAQVLQQVYSSLSQAEIDGKNQESSTSTQPPINLNCKTEKCYKKDPPFSPVLPVKPPLAEPGLLPKDTVSAYGNFIVDPKTGSILMVVRREELTQVKMLLEKLDVPKKMVQIDVLLVEKNMRDNKQIGINLLKIGSAADNVRRSAISFDTNKKAKNKGILEFILSRPKGDFPAFDLIYHFLLAQDNICVNANPSVLAINHTPATISLVEEISINNGAVPIDTPAGGVAVEQSYTRAQYGITLVMTPTIHLPNIDEEESKGFITLQSNVTFDTTGISDDDRPPVARRHIQNEVRVADGETIILGGLKRKSCEEKREKIPFLGDIPGVGKLFGLTKTMDRSTEMIIFITPRIVRDPIEGLREMRKCKMRQRAGDIPEFLQRLQEARQKEKTGTFEKSLSLLFDKI